MTSRRCSAKPWPCSRPGRLAEAAEHYRKVLARNPRCEEALANLVSVFLEKKDHRPVRRYAEMLAELQPESPVALEALAALAFEDGDYAAAARYSHSLSELVPERFENWFNLGVAHHKMGDYEKAAQAYTEAIALKPDSVAGLSESGGGAAGIERPGGRAHLLREGAADRSRPARRSLEPGAGAGAAGRAGPGREALCQASRGCAGVVRRALPAGLSAAAARRLRRPAPRRLRPASKSGRIGPKRISTPASRMRARATPDAARRCFEEALMLRPDSSDAMRGLAALALDCQDYAKAYDLHRRLIELGEHGPELYYNAGLLCQKLGRTEEAVKFYQQALGEDPQRLEALLNLGHVLMASGKAEEARSCWRRAIREKPELAEAYFEP